MGRNINQKQGAGEVVMGDNTWHFEKIHIQLLRLGKDNYIVLKLVDFLFFINL